MDRGGRVCVCVCGGVGRKGVVVISTSPLPHSFFGTCAFLISRHIDELVRNLAVRPPFWFALVVNKEIRSVTGQMWRGGQRAVGKISRTAAGSSASLTIVWQEFRFQLCTSLLVSSSPSLPAYIFKYSVKSSLSFPTFFFLLLVLGFFYFESPSPSYVFAVSQLPKPQHTLKAGL